VTPGAPTFGKDVKGAAGFLLAGVPALASLLAAVSITGDTAGRMARNHPYATIGAFGLAAVAAFLGAFAAFGVTAGSRAERNAIHAGIAALAAALAFGIYASVETWGDRPQPSITLRPRTPSSVSVTVTASGLRRGDHISVEVEQLLRGSDRSWQPGLPLYGASLGPDGDGNVKQTVDLFVPPGDFDDIGARAWVGDEPAPCYGRGTTTGCVRVHLPRPQERPQLSVDWETFVAAPRLLVKLKARNQQPARWMALRAYGENTGQPARMLAEWALAPDADGLFDRRVAVVAGHRYSDVCVVASTTTRQPECPPVDDDGTVWARLAVPAK
jgi:hypothetical protein